MRSRAVTSFASLVIFGLMSCSTVEPTGNQPANVPVGVIQNPLDSLNSADYLVVCADSLAASARSFCEFRKQQARADIDSVALIKWSAIKNLNGLTGCQSLKTFLDYACRHWHKKPSYVLLLGNSTVNGDQTQGIPEVDSLTAANSDNYYCDTNPDGTFKFCLGRIPAENNSQADSVLNKIITFEGSPHRRAAFVVDDSCQGQNRDPLDFYQAFHDIIGDMDTGNMRIDSFLLAAHGTGCNWDSTTIAALRPQVFQFLNEENGFVCLLGHSNQTLFTDEHILTISDTGLLARNAVYFLSGSYQGEFTSAGIGSGILLKSTTGAAAVIACTGLTYLNRGTAFHQMAFSLLSKRQVQTIGILFRRSQENERLGVWNNRILLGDPAMQIVY
jgi:hypothetical protein